MRRTGSCLLILVLSLPLMLTAFVMVRFELERDRIIQEECVQRFKPIEQNCCKGQCHLEKRLQAAEDGRSNAPTPPRLEVRVEAAIATAVDPWMQERIPYVRSFRPDVDADVAAGHAGIADPVPWC